MPHTDNYKHMSHAFTWINCIETEHNLSMYLKHNRNCYNCILTYKLLSSKYLPIIDFCICWCFYTWYVICRLSLSTKTQFIITSDAFQSTTQVIPVTHYWVTVTRKTQMVKCETSYTHVTNNLSQFLHGTISSYLDVTISSCCNTFISQFLYVTISSCHNFSMSYYFQVTISSSSYYTFMS